jgi:hypothetical protein
MKMNMAKKTKKTAENKEIAVQPEKQGSEATESLLTIEPVEVSNVSQNESCAELQKASPQITADNETCPQIPQTGADNETCPQITQMDADSETCPQITQMDADNETRPQITQTEADIIETCPQITQMDADNETRPQIAQMDADNETCPQITQMDADNETRPQIPQMDADEADNEVETLEPESVEASVLQKNQCPRCKHVNSERCFVFPGVNRVVAPGVYEGIQYQIVETRRTKCEKCGQVFCIKKYL